MKRHVAPLGILAILLALSPAWAAGKQTAPDLDTIMTSNGTVTAVDAGAKTVTVKVDGKNGDMQAMTFEITPTSKIVKASQAIQLSQLASGDQVTVTYKKDGMKNLVVNIGVEKTS